MGITLEYILEKFSDFRGALEYYLSSIGYTSTDIDNMLEDLEQKIMESRDK